MAIKLGTAGNDLLIGTNSDDIFFAGNGDDVAFGGAGNDLFFGSQGNDTFNGGAGVDTVDYSQVTNPSGVLVALTDGEGFAGDGEGGTDRLISIENVTGSNQNDLLIGNSAANHIRGLNGDDEISGGGGADTLEGGAGIDTLLYDSSFAGVTVDLLNGITSGGEATGDQISGFENLSGSRFADFLFGTNGANEMRGNDGADILFGRGGDDVLLGGAGRDRLDGGTGADRLNGGEGDDLLTGGSGRDTFVFSPTFRQDQGHDTISDFQGGLDRIALVGVDPESVHFSLTRESPGVFDLTIAYGTNGETVTLDNIATSDIVQAMMSIDFA